MNRVPIRPSVLAACGLLAVSAFAQVDYSKEKQRNPTGDPQVEKGYQDTRKEILDKRAAEGKQQGTRESTGTTKQEGESYGKDWQEKQLGTKDKVRTW